VGARVAAFQTSGRPDPTAAAENVTREFVQLMLQQLTSNLATSKEFCPFDSERRGSQPGALIKKKQRDMTDTITDVLVVNQDPGSSSHTIFQSPEAKAYKRDPIITNNAATASGADPPPDNPWADRAYDGSYDSPSVNTAGNDGQWQNPSDGSSSTEHEDDRGYVDPSTVPNRRRRRSPGGPPDDDDSDGGNGGGGGGGGGGGNNPGGGRGPGGGAGPPGGPGGGGNGPPGSNHAAVGPNNKLSQTTHSGPLAGRNPLNPGFNPSDLFGNALKRDGIILLNTSWKVGEGNERLCYRIRELEVKLKLPKWLPQSHAAAIRWFRELLRAFQKIDITKGLIVVEWLRVIENFPMEIHKRDIIPKLHDDAQGMDLLDRYWGSECYHHIRDPIFGVEMAAYFHWCEENRCAPSGRACAAMVTHRYRKRPDAARLTALKALWSIKCQAHSFQGVATFISKVRLAFQHLCVGDIYDEEYAYDWLWQNLKDFAGIKKYVDKIISARDLPDKAYRRTWN